MLKRIILVFVFTFLCCSVFAKEKIDNVIARAAEDIVQKCDAKSIRLHGLALAHPTIKRQDVSEANERWH